MNLRTLRYFVTIAEAGSFSAAALRIPLAQPALSRQMRDLEAELGLTLFVRQPRGILLTAAGVTLLGGAQRILAESARLREKLAREAGASRSTVALGAPPTLARLLLPGLFERMAQPLKGVELRLREAFTPSLLDWLERGVIDMAVVTNPDAGRSLSFRPILSEPFALFANRALGLKPLAPIGRLAELPLLLTSLHRTILERQLSGVAIALRVHSEIDSVDAIREIVAGGPWATIMPVSVFRGADPDPRITMSEISGIQLNRQLALATRPDPGGDAILALLGEMLDGEFALLAERGAFSLGAAAAMRPPG